MLTCEEALGRDEMNRRGCGLGSRTLIAGWCFQPLQWRSPGAEPWMA